MQEAAEMGILSINHRSDRFMEIMQQTKTAITRTLHVPEGYAILFTSSATECWEILAQSLLKGSSLHVFNGAFGEKWYSYAHNIKRGSEEYVYGLQETLPVEELLIPLMAEMVCITQNETSNGTKVSTNLIAHLKEISPGTLVAVDATSSLAGEALDLKTADVWFASVQKCFGLPAGLGVLLVSERAQERAAYIREEGRYNSLLSSLSFAQKNQTPYTPNVLGVYLLGKVCVELGETTQYYPALATRAQRLYRYFEQHPVLQPLIHTEEVRSDTVIAVRGKSEMIQKAHLLAEEAGLLLGKGYGKWEKETFRVANFPAHEDEDHTYFMEALQNL
jgi:phosphoserine aminotransferase